MGINLDLLNTTGLLSSSSSAQDKSFINECKECEFINELPEELLQKILNLLFSLEPNGNASMLVCKKWLQIFDTHPLKLLKRGDFNPRILQGPVSTLVKDTEEFERLNTLLGPWMDKQIKRLSDNTQALITPTTYNLAKYFQLFLSKINFLKTQINSLNTNDVLEIHDKKKINEKHKIFILENLWLTTFNTSTPCTNEEVNKWINICKSLQITIYKPLQHFRQVLYKLNPEEISSRTWEEVFRMQFLSLKDVPVEKRTQTICLAAVTQNGWAIQFVPQRIAAIWLAAVTQSGQVLQFVPLEEKTQTIYLAAVTQNGGALHFVPEIDRTQAICLAAVTQNGGALRFVPEINRTQAICLAAVTQNGEALQVVPKINRTQAICLAAVTQNGLALQFVPLKERTQAIYLAAVTQNGLALQDVPEIDRTQAICLAAVTQNGLALQVVPEINRTQAIYLAAVTQTRWAFQFVPLKERTQAICLAVVKQNGWALQNVPEKEKTPAVCLAAVEQNGWALEYVPIKERNQTVYLAAVTQNGLMLQDVPETDRTQAICLAAVKQNGWAFEYVPLKERTEAIYKAYDLAIAKQNTSHFQFMPEIKKNHLAYVR